jgi:hypothetical protein
MLDGARQRGGGLAAPLFVNESYQHHYLPHTFSEVKMRRSASGVLNSAIDTAAQPLPSQKPATAVRSTLRGDEDFSLASVGVQSTVHRNLPPAALYEWALKACPRFFLGLLRFVLHV